MRFYHYGLTFLVVLVTTSCQVIKPYAPEPQRVVVESVEVEIREFAGRPEAYATVKGRLTSNAAQLVDPKQSRIDNNLYIEVLEQTPRDAVLLPNLSQAPPFQTRIPIELLGLDPGTYILNANGVETSFEIAPLHAGLVSEDTPAPETPSAVKLIDEFIPIEESGIPGTEAPPL